jgi:hypothetical protein
MSTCAVRHLHVAAASEPAARRFVTTLEDALRCATLPGDDRRVVVVRRLALGRVAHDAGTQRLSLLIEQRLARGEVAWADAERPPDPRADIIGFAGALEARVHLARRLVQASPCDAWYWPLAVAEYRRDLLPREALRRIAHALATLPEGRVGLPEWVAQVVRVGGAGLLCSAIDETRGPALLRAAGIPLPPETPASIDNRRHARKAIDAAPSHADASSDAGPQARDASARARDAATLAPSTLPPWLRATLARTRNEPDRVEPNIAPAITLAAAPASMMPAATAPARPAGSASRNGTTTSIASTTTPLIASIDQRPQAPASIEPTPVANARPVIETRPDTATDWRPTACGGLLFLLPVLARAGLVQRDSPDADRAAALHVLRAALRRLRAAPEDAAWTLVDELSPLPPGPSCAVEVRAVHELAAARRWLHRHARLGLATLVRRPARLALTATHIDVRFPLSGADVRVRRLGLDADPGWLAWFGRVIAFQFVGRLP